MKHTQAPWIIEKDITNKSCHYTYIYGVSKYGSKIQVCEVNAHINPYSNNGMTYEANANLIAAAPELLNALENFINAVDNYQDLDNAYSMAKSAIKKAKGE